MAGVEIEDNTGAFMAALIMAKRRALRIIGEKWRDNAKRQTDTFEYWGPELMQSIDYEIDTAKYSVSVGSNLEIAAYAELGTGKEYSPPKDYIENKVPKGTIVPAGIDHWIYFDPVERVFKVGAPQKARPYLQPAFDEHQDEYKRVWETELKDANPSG